MDIQLDNLDFHTLRLIDETGAYIVIDLKAELAINENNLDREMLQQPAKYVYWSSILERLRYFQESAELELEVLEGRLDNEAREELPKEGVKPTKDSVENYMKRKEEYVIAREKCNTYDYLVRRLHFIVKSFEQRKDMLQSYGKQLANDKSYGHGAGSHMEQNPYPPQAPQS